MFFDKRVRAAWRKKGFYALLLLCFAAVLTGVDFPFAYQVMSGPEPLQHLGLPMLAMLLTYTGLLITARQYGRANDDIERLKGER